MIKNPVRSCSSDRDCNNEILHKYIVTLKTEF